MRKAVCLVLLSVCLSTVFGCASSQETQLVGKWVSKASGDRMELLANHTCTISSMGFQYQGKWTAAASGINIDAGQVTMKGSFDGKNILAEDAVMHNKYVYEKVAPKS